MKHSTIIGKTFTSIEVIEADGRNREILFSASNGAKYRMYHPLESTEIMAVTNIIGDLQDLLNSPITFVDKESNEKDIYARLHSPGSLLYGKDYYKTMRTVYTIRTAREKVRIVWIGELTEGITHEEDDKFDEVHFNHALEIYDIPELVGKTIIDLDPIVEIDGKYREMIITMSDGTKYRIYHRSGGVMSMHIHEDLIKLFDLKLPLERVIKDTNEKGVYEQQPLQRGDVTSQIINSHISNYYYFCIGKLRAKLMWSGLIGKGDKDGEVYLTILGNDDNLLHKPIDRVEYASFDAQSTSSL